jgi:hypothetical protein
MEVYSAGVGSGQYPGAVNVLSRTGGEFPYEINGTTRGGYSLDATYNAASYSCLANSTAAATGDFDYQITTGARLQRRPFGGGTWQNIP